MHKFHTCFVYGTALVCIAVICAYGGDKGRRIARAYFDLKDARTMRAEATMVLIDEDNGRSERRLVMYEKNEPRGMSSFIEFDAPAAVKGTKFLTVPDDKGNDIQRLYLPALKKVRRISAANNDGKFVGSDFYYYDLKDREFEDFSYTFVKEATMNDAAYNVIEMVPENEDESPYSKSRAWVKKKDHFVYRMELYDKDSEKLIKTMAVVETRTIEGVIVPVKVVMDNHRDNHKTLLQLDNVEVNSDVDENVFTVQYLKR